jgi:hypothetical protein
LYRDDDSISAYHEVLKIAEEDEDKRFIAEALEGLAYHFAGIGRTEHAVALYDEIISRFQTHSELERIVNKAIEGRDNILGGCSPREGLSKSVSDSAVRPLVS